LAIRNQKLSDTTRIAQYRIGRRAR